MYRSTLGRWALGAGATITLVAAAGCGSSASTTRATTKPANAPSLIASKNIAFQPTTVQIKAGASVTWKWEDADIATAHDVTSIGPAHFASSPSKMTGTYTVRFTRPGIYHFECTIHPLSMQGDIIVQKAT